MKHASANSSSAVRAAAIEALESRVLLTRVLGIDVSHWDGSINWVSVKGGGYDFAWAKATEGTGFFDSTFVTNETNAKAAGVKIGAYHFPRWDQHPNITGANSADTEADYYWSKVSAYVKAGGSYLQPMLDVENVSISGVTHAPGEYGFTKTTFSQWVNEWCNNIVAKGTAAGLTLVPVLYCGTEMSQTYIDSTVSQNFPLWHPNWPSNPDPQTGAPNSTTPWQTWQFWQYTDSGTVPGISGACDLDVLNGDSNVLQDYIIGSAGRWADGATVQVGSSSIKAWATSAVNSTYTTVASGTIGTVLQGPIYGNGYQRWQVQFKNGVSGWCAEDLMNTVTTAPAIVTTPTPAANAALTTKPATLSWADSPLATSYNVYLDGTLKGNVTTTSWSTTGTTIADGAHTWRIDAKDSVGTTTGTTWNFTLNTGNPTFATQNGSTLNIQFDGTTTPIAIGVSGSNITVTRLSTTLTFSGVTAINVTGTSSADTFNFNFPVTPAALPPVTLALGAGADVLNVNSGTFTFAADASPGTANLTINNSSIINFNASQHLKGLNLTGGNAYMATGGNKVMVLDTITASNGGKIDLRNEDMIIHNITLADATALVKAGFGNFDWLGSGITSSHAASNVATAATSLGVIQAGDWGYTTFDSQPVGGTDVLIKYTWTADANLDGIIDGDDFNKFLDGYNNGLPSLFPPTWFNGDYDFNGVVDGDDFNYFIDGMTAFNNTGHLQL